MKKITQKLKNVNITRKNDTRVVIADSKQVKKAVSFVINNYSYDLKELAKY